MTIVINSFSLSTQCSLLSNASLTYYKMPNNMLTMFHLSRDALSLLPSVYLETGIFIETINGQSEHLFHIDHTCYRSYYEFSN